MKNLNTAIPGVQSCARDLHVKLTVDGKPQTQPLTVVMDPRSPATPETLRQQLQLGQQIFAETMEARRALAEIASLQKQLADLQQKLGEKDSAIKPALADAQTELSKIVTEPGDARAGRRTAGRFRRTGIGLRVVEGGDRAVPSQAIALYNESSSASRQPSQNGASSKQQTSTAESETV